MVTSNKINDKKVVKMSEPSGAVVIPQRTLLGEVNEHITCPLCRGYYIDATTIVECLHSFCRSCIIKHLQVKSYCPVCEMMINSAKPNIKLDKALQDIVYKLVPGLFQKEMERRQHFYASRPGPAASATPEQRGEDTERIIFSPEDVISFSLEYADVTDTDSVSSKSSDSNESQPTSTITRRYLQCPAVVNISHLKKFLSMKFDIDSTQFAIDILYKRVPLPDYYTLMDIAYIYNWKRNEPMRFFYQIIDYVALRHRFFDVNRKDSHFRDRKSSPVPTEESNVISPTQNVTDQGSEVSSGVDSPMPGDNNNKKTNDDIKKSDKCSLESKESSHNTNESKSECATSKKDEDVEKSQFLNSFELTAKNNCTTLKSSPSKSNLTEAPSKSIDSSTKPQVVPKIEESLKRKQSLSNVPEMKKLKIELEKTKLPTVPIKQDNVGSSATSKEKSNEKPKEELDLNAQKKLPTISTNSPMSTAFATKETKSPTPALKQILTSDTLPSKRISSTPENITSPKKKLCSDNAVSSQQHAINQKLMSPIKTPVSKVETQLPLPKAIDTPKPSAKRLPDLKPSAPPSQTSHNKVQPVNKVRMDLLANNSDPTIDRSKILTQVKSALPLPSASTVQGSGDPLKSLFDSCKINIPSSLSITLTEQKLDQQTPSDPTSNDLKKCVTSKSSVSNTNTGTHKLPNPPVHNYIEILKLPDTDNATKSDTPATNSSKGPVPNLKPISDTKIGKQSGHFTGPITFQQTFEQQVQSMQSDKKTKVGRTNKLALPKLVPATPKAISVANKLNNLNNKPNISGVPPNEIKSTAALDLSTPHNVQTRKLETMQSIANLAKQQSFAPKSLPLSQGVSQSNLYSTMSNRLMSNTGNALRVPTPNLNQIKASPNISQPTLRPEVPNKTNAMKSGNTVRPTIPSPCSTYSHPSPNAPLPSPRSQTRSPSSSPKLVIAEEKQMGNMFLESSVKQTNQGTSAQFSSSNANKESKALSGPSKPTSKPVKQTSSPSGKSPIQTSSLMQTLKPNPPLNSAADFLLQSPFITHHAFMSQQMDSIQNVWLKARNMGFLKNMTQQSQDDYRKDKS